MQLIKTAVFYSGLYPGLSNYNTIKKFFPCFAGGCSSYPVSVNLLITSRCNFRCSMCSFYGVEQSGEEKELGFEEIKKFIEEISRYKPIVFLGGGEPFIRKDIYEIIAEIKKQGLKCIVSTNGYLLDIDKLNKLNIDYLIISLYGPRDIHNKVTQTPDAYQAVIKKIRQLLKSSSVNRIIVSVVLMPENIVHLDGLIAELVSLGIKTVKIENLNYITFKEYQESPRLKEGFDITPCTLIRENDFKSSDIELFWRIVSKLFKKYKGKLFLKPNLSKIEFFNWYSGKNIKDKCHFIKHSLFISPSGDILPCQFLRNSILGKINQNEIEYIWHSNRYDNLRQVIRGTDLNICKRCCK